MAKEMRSGFRVKKHVTRPQLKLKPGVEYYVTIAGPMFLGKKLEDGKEPATLVNIVELTRGEQMQMILPKVMRDSLVEQYPADAFIGKSFAFELMREQDAEGKQKRYNTLQTFVEIEPTEAQTTTAKDDSKRKAA